MKKLNFLIIALLFCSFSTKVSKAQSCDVCGNALTYAQDEYVYDNYSSVLFKLDKLYSMSRDEYNKYRSKDKLNIWSYEYGTLDYKNEKNRVKKLKKKYEGRESIEFSREDKLFISKKIGNPLAYKSFDKCIEACMNRNVSMVVPRIDSYSDFVLKIYPVSPGETTVKIYQVKLVNADFVSDDDKLYKGKQLSTGQPIVVSLRKKNKNRDAKVTIIFEGEANRINEINIPAPTPKPKKPDCLANFIESNDSPTTGSDKAKEVLRTTPFDTERCARITVSASVTAHGSEGEMTIRLFEQDMDGNPIAKEYFSYKGNNNLSGSLTKIIKIPANESKIIIAHVANKNATAKIVKVKIEYSE